MAAPAAEQLLGSMGQQLHQLLDRREQAADLAMPRIILFSSIGLEVGAASAGTCSPSAPHCQPRLAMRSDRCMLPPLHMRTALFFMSKDEHLCFCPVGMHTCSALTI